jgi:hypothetical protein
MASDKYQTTDPLKLMIYGRKSNYIKPKLFVVLQPTTIAAPSLELESNPAPHGSKD